MNRAELISFTDELAGIAGFEKIALLAKTPEMKAKDKAERHFSTSDPDWGEFVKSLRSKHFQREIASHPMADEKLKKYVKNYGGYVASRDVVGHVPSERTTRKYTLKKVGRRIGCNCGDWQYVHSHKGGDCKHVEKFKKGKTKRSMAELVKHAFMTDLLHAASLADRSNRRAQKKLQVGSLAAQSTRQLSANELALQQQKRMSQGPFA
jgi:hypothetical protein